METVLRLGGLIVGIFIVGSTALSVFTALVVPRVTSSRAMRTVAKIIGVTARQILPRLPSYEARDRLMAYVGPLSMVSLFVLWLASLVLGFGLITWWISGQDFGTALGISGSSVFTLGIATSPGSSSRVDRDHRGLRRPAGDRAGDRVPACALQRVLHPGDRSHAAGQPLGHAGLGSRDPGPASHVGQHRRAARPLRRLGTVGGRGVGEPCQLPGSDLVPLSGFDPQLVAQPGGHDGLRRALSRREPHRDAPSGPALPLDGHQLPALHCRGPADPLRRRPDPDRRHEADEGGVHRRLLPPRRGALPDGARPGRRLAPFSGLAGQLRVDRRHPDQAGDAAAGAVVPAPPRIGAGRVAHRAQPLAGRPRRPPSVRAGDRFQDAAGARPPLASIRRTRVDHEPGSGHRHRRSGELQCQGPK